MIKKIFKYSLIIAILSIIIGIITDKEMFIFAFFISILLTLISSIFLLDSIGNKKCPYCQEWIDKKAIKCRHCQSIIK